MRLQTVGKYGRYFICDLFIAASYNLYMNQLKSAQVDVSLIKPVELVAIRHKP
jgi:hypothetical protein